MKLGVIGLPNVGKSTLFNAITKAGAQAANYPFCTIEPNVGIVNVPDERLEVLNEMLPRLEALPDFSFENVEKVVKDYVAEKECKNGLALWPLRTAVSGKQMTPGGAYEIMDILGKEESLKRIRKGIELLNGVQ